MPLKKITIEFPPNVFPLPPGDVTLRDQGGNHICRISYDTPLSQVILTVVSNICKKAGIEFDSASSGHDVTEEDFKC